MSTIIEVPIGENPDFQKLKKVCAHFNCKVKKKAGNYYQITTEDPINLFWLGMNLNHMLS